MNKNKSLTAREVAVRRGCTLDLVYRELWAGRYPNAQKLGKKWLIPEADLKGAK